MPHYTGTGDDGETTLWGGARVPKHHPQPETYGALDEATSALGLARALSTAPRTDGVAQELQQHFYRLMAELAVASGKPVPEQFVTNEEHVAAIEAVIETLESEAPPPTEFVLPGGSAAGGAIDLARAITRRAEREASRLRASGYELNPQVMRLLNRASALLYSLARYEEHAGGSDAPTTHMPLKGGRG